MESENFKLQKLFVASLFFTLTSLLSSFQLYSQSDTVNRVHKNDVFIKLAPLSFINPNFSTIDFGASYFLSDRLGVQVKFGIAPGVFEGESSRTTHGLKMGIEYQYFVSRKIYVGFENGISSRHFDGMVLFYEPIGDQHIRDNFSAIEESLYIVPKFGVMLFVTNRLAVDFYAGLGLQRFSRKVFDLEFDETKGHRDFTTYEWLTTPNYTTKDEFRERVTIGLNINFRL